MKKTIILLIILLLLTGCEVNYNLTFDGSKITEDINGFVDKKTILDLDEDTTGINIYRELLYNEQNVFDTSSAVYKQKVSETNGIVSFDYSYTYFNRYNEARIIKHCFKNPVIIDGEEAYTIKLTGPFYCLYGDKINVNITSDYKITNHNAKEVKENTYTWVIDDNENVDIELTVSKQIKNTKENIKVSTFKIVGLVVLVILSIVAFFLYRNKNRE